ARREDARHGEWRVRMRVEERVRPAEPAQPPAEKLRYANGEEAERERRRRVRRERSDSGTLEDPAKRRAERIVPGTTASIVVHERMNDADNREARTGGIADRGPATIRVPAEDLAGEMQAAHGVYTRGQLHTTRRHLENVCSACRIEHVRTAEETRERLTIPAVTHEAEAGVGRNFVRDAAHVAAPATQRDMRKVRSHKT